MIRSDFKKYDSYKPSGFDWLGDVPSTWNLSRHKDHFTFLSDRCLDPSLKKIGLENIEGKTGQFIPTESKFEGNGIEFKINDILFGKLRPYLAKVYLAEFTGNAVGDIFVYRPKRSISPRFGKYLMLSDRYIDVMNSSTAGAKMPRVSSSFIANLPVAVPPILEQEAIADCLDDQTKKLDYQIDLLTKKSIQYSKLKQSLINETVTRGLDKTVLKKDSGVEWIGKVPEHWSIERIGTAFDERREKVSDKDYPPLSVTMNGIVPQLETAAKTDHNDNRKRVAVNDFVINSRSDRRGSSGVSELDGSVSVINIVLTPRKNFFGRYLHHLFRSYSFIEEFYRVGRGIVDDLWTTKYSVMKAIEFAFPEYEEQKEIANYLDNKIAHINSIVDIINSKIEKLKELRKALINDMIAGKIRVEKAEAGGALQYERNTFAR